MEITNLSTMENYSTCENYKSTSPTLSEVQKFYNGTTVFLTGATGFVGNLILEKLIRTCSGIKTVYILIREKKGKSAQQRFKDLFNDPLFDLMKKESPDYLKKVAALIGDCEQPNLGMNEHDREVIKNEVNIVIHSAATVRFDEHLRKAVRINIIALQDFLKLSQEIKYLKAFVHISTAYSNCAGRKTVDEGFYDLPLSGDNLIQVVNNLSDEYINNVTAAILNKWPNTYTMTKAIAEGEILRYGNGLPIGVIRPSMIIATANEPVRGWINNVYGPTGVVAAAAAGFLRVMYADSKINADCIPGDFVSNAVIVSAWDVHNKWKSYSEQNSLEAESAAVETFSPPIYHCVSTSTNPFTWGEFSHYNKKHGSYISFNKSIFPPMLTLTDSIFKFKIISFLIHIIPAMIIDWLATLTGKAPRLVNQYDKLHKFIDVISYFSVRSWTFKDLNLKTMIKSMSNQDKALFDFDISKLDWDDYFRNQIMGIKLYIFKEPMETVPEGKKHYNTLKVSFYIIFAFLGSLLLLILYGFLKLFL